MIARIILAAAGFLFVVMGDAPALTNLFVNASGVVNAPMNIGTNVLTATKVKGQIFGSNAGDVTVSGDNHHAFGYDAAEGADGYYYYAIGDNAMEFSTNRFSHGFGRSAGKGSIGTNNTYIGAWAGQNATGSDQLFIDQSPSDPGGAVVATNAFIYAYANALHIGRPDGYIIPRGFFVTIPLQFGYITTMDTGSATQLIWIVSGFTNVIDADGRAP